MSLKILFSDIYWVFWREIKKFVQQKARILMIVIQPLVWLVLMGYSMAGLTSNPEAAKMLGTGNYLDFMAPGVMIMTALFGGVFGGTTIVWDRRTGFLNKMLAAPIHRAAIPLGKLFSIGFQTILQALIIVIISLFLGVHFVTGFPGVLVMLILSGIFGMFMGGISLSLASRIKSMETLMAITNFLTMPLMFTSNAMFPTSAMPHWLKAIAQANPLSYAVHAMRTISTQGWIWSEIWPAVTALVVITGLMTALAIKLFARTVS
ncbi:MAG: ABC transporter [Bacteroidetes bacterium GWF2_49_14]|nr:MAG: ABC transporter [Bacteroidetes bacterium GWF2_49_14]HBB92800.1 ABC transporter [Bacteroidales bacterium]